MTILRYQAAESNPKLVSTDKTVGLVKQNDRKTMLIKEVSDPFCHCDGITIMPRRVEKQCFFV